MSVPTGAGAPGGSLAGEPLDDAPDERVDHCPLCGSAIHRTLFRDPPYEVRRCGVCELGYVTPRRSAAALAAMYGADTYWRSPSPKTHGYADYRSEQPRYLRTFRTRLRHALAHGPQGGRALDVGAAAGFCMAVLRERGFDTYGVEVSPVIAAYGQGELGFGDRIFVGTLADAPFAAGSFDLVSMWDLVEHVPDPVALLVRARELLAPGGRLVLETQDLDSRFARLLGQRWHHFKHAEHIYHFNPSSIRRLLAEAGFEVDSLTHRYGGKYVSTGFIAERAGRLHPVASRALAPIARRTERIDLYLNFLDEMVVRARPR